MSLNQVAQRHSLGLEGGAVNFEIRSTQGWLATGQVERTLTWILASEGW
jgi:hypothetical protein